ncbi:hypothetical protein HYH03_003877 [Edaphochlamys debaryana]|uniref:Peptidase S74 domain-containing protein n=1 Tax=Edaphochlamys debaryana TaxID=47281 RepID=A0A835YAH0_9CHLO|nr:hypothetical protein HYH03_003877 [Edaphochlamys debaryana]|eukprot:KAG2498119.1 hypothetical protein HYH03_003877 [Edaphochlamys debaryana]
MYGTDTGVAETGIRVCTKVAAGDFKVLSALENNSEVFTIWNAFIGISNALPSYPLDVNGTVCACNLFTGGSNIAVRIDYGSNTATWASNNAGSSASVTFASNAAVSGSNSGNWASNNALVTTGGTMTGTITFTAGRLIGDSNDSAAQPFYSWQGSTSNGMYLPNSNQVGLAIRSSNVLFLNSNFTVGVGGQSNPAAMLDVLGTLRAYAGHTTGGVIMGNTTSNVDVDAIVQVAGMSGQRTAFASYHGDTTDQYHYVMNNPTGRVGYLSTAGSNFFIRGYGGAAAGGTICIGSNGNVGIGNTAPQANLHVNGTLRASTSSTAGIILGNTTSNIDIDSVVQIAGVANVRAVLGSYVGDALGEQSHFILNNPYGRVGYMTSIGSNMYFRGYGGNTGATLCIGSNGNIGVNTVVPQASFHVNQDLYMPANSANWNSTAGKGLYVRFSSNSTRQEDAAYVQSINRSTAAYHNMSIEASNLAVGQSGALSNPTLYVQYGGTSGRVGVATVNPTHSLTVSSTGRFTGDLTGTNINASNALQEGGSNVTPRILFGSNTGVWTCNNTLKLTGGTLSGSIQMTNGTLLASNLSVSVPVPTCPLDTFRDFQGTGGYVGRIWGTDFGVLETGVRVCTKMAGGDFKVLSAMNNNFEIFTIRNSAIGISNAVPNAAYALDVNGTVYACNLFTGGSNIATQINWTSNNALIKTGGAMSGTVTFTGGKLIGSSNDSAAQPFYLWQGNTSNGMYLPNSNQVGLSIRSSNVLFLNSNFTVGVGGQSNPAATLDVLGTLRAYPGNVTGGVLLGNTTSNIDVDAVVQVAGMASQRTSFATYNGDVSEQYHYVMVNPTGRVGYMATAGSNLFIRGYGGNSTGASICFSSNNNFIGINTPGPLANFHLNHDLHIAANSSVWNSTAGKGLYVRYSTFAPHDTAFIQSISRVSGLYYNLSIEASNVFIGQASSMVNPTLTVQYGGTNGRVGVGTSNPSYPLHVASGAGTTSIYAAGDIIGLSDQSVKTNLEVIPDALLKTLQVSGYTFRRKDFSSSNRCAGVIAQEIQAVLPEVVYKDEVSGRLAVSYGNLSALLIEAIKELQRETDKRVRALERTVAELQARAWISS